MRDDKGRWVPGSLVDSPRPGRPAGRAELERRFLEALKKTFEERGQEALTEFCATDPGGFCKMLASMMPKAVMVEDNAGLADRLLAVMERVAPPLPDIEQEAIRIAHNKE